MDFFRVSGLGALLNRRHFRFEDSTEENEIAGGCKCLEAVTPMDSGMGPLQTADALSLNEARLPKKSFFPSFS